MSVRSFHLASRYFNLKREDGTECRATRGRPLVKVRLARHVRVYPPAIVQHAGQSGTSVARSNTLSVYPDSL